MSTGTRTSPVKLAAIKKAPSIEKPPKATPMQKGLPCFRGLEKCIYVIGLNREPILGKVNSNASVVKNTMQQIAQRILE
jgi:hypothetical protein